MPNITIYLDDETYVKFRGLPDGKQTEIRELLIDALQEEIDSMK